MNIFRLDNDPKKAAQYHNDRHVVKMILESAQLLSTAHFFYGGKASAPLRPTHVNHPCAIWVRESAEAYRWTHQLMGGLLEEYTYRYGKTHAYAPTFIQLADVPALIPRKFVGEPPQCMPGPYQRINKPVQAYRTYYFADKQHLAKWTKRGAPRWWIEMEAAYTEVGV